ncbi:hypothetical protein MGYG_01743 [Nannizzia gypsea CBS 118893]|uniref:Pre-rRNA processing protein n=1 Tax=Arthroderma gypseum (strain ATCC MYA-4604 / CBS 118893) TaxID=535722 RepID=E5R321_ARTGP|nr:hypothetical protein MGYG_01743 [Nannizzia gypsea CBS 118893]EFQ98725.1 hypothetical protein MGYG_01743 [Nannizzia gypsea CBS 118893]
MTNNSTTSSPGKWQSSRPFNHPEDHDRDQGLSETTPLLAHRDEDLEDDDDSADSVAQQKKRGLRWPTVTALVVLCLSVIAILILGFAAPSMMKQYVQEATTFKPTGLSITSFTPSGIKARVRGTLVLDASRVKNPTIRDLGRFGTWIGREVETENSMVEVYLPEYDDALLATVTIPPIKVTVRNGYLNEIDFIAELATGDPDGIKGAISDFIEGNIAQLSLKGMAKVPLKSGILYLGSQHITETVVLQDFSSPPDFNITKLDVHERSGPGKSKAIVADVSVAISNRYPVHLTLPPVEFNILVPSCAPDDAYIMVANATTDSVSIEPSEPVTISMHGFAPKVPQELISSCPGTTTSPLDLLISKYIRGLVTTIYVRGGSLVSPAVPQWLQELLNSVTIPFPFTSPGFSRLIKRFSMKNVQFYLPSPFAKPNTPESMPKVSALVQAVVDLPRQLDVPVNVSRVRTNANVFYHDHKLGIIDIKEWQNARVRRVVDDSDGKPTMVVEFDIQKAPLQVTDEDLLSEVLQKMLFERQDIPLRVDAHVDAELQSALGEFIVRDIPSGGNIIVRPPYGSGATFNDINLHMQSIKVVETTKDSVLSRVTVDFTNPTNYTAHMPYFDIKLVHNSSDVAHIIGHNLHIHPGQNTGVKIDALWSPLESGSKEGATAGRDLVSKCVSGKNTTVTLKAYTNTIPSLPRLGKALSKVEIEVPLPKLHLPGQGDGNSGSLIKDATLHLLTSTADFTIMSPLSSETLYITHINATSFFNHTSPVGTIQYDMSFAVPPGSSLSPRLPVHPDLTGAGYQALKDALGGALHLDLLADIGVRLGEYRQTVDYTGQGIGINVGW